MPIRNPFARRAAGTDENTGSGSTVSDAQSQPPVPSFERVDTIGSQVSNVSNGRRSQDTGDYKMSVVNDSGVYLPPSPTEHESTWPRRYLARHAASQSLSLDTRKSGPGADTGAAAGAVPPRGEIEAFSISRESFDSYRRSFDISARSPLSVSEFAPRQSLDSARLPMPPRRRLPRTSADLASMSASSSPHRRWEREPPTAEEGFEDVGLNDDANSNNAATTATDGYFKRRGLFAKFGGDHSTAASSSTATAANPDSSSSFVASAASLAPSVSRFLLPSRKRAQSGQGAELSPMDSRPSTAGRSETAEAQG